MKDVMETAIEAIEKVFSDRTVPPEYMMEGQAAHIFPDQTVPPEITMENLIELRDLVNGHIAALESDITTCVNCGKAILDQCKCSTKEILVHQQAQIGRLERENENLRNWRNAQENYAIRLQKLIEAFGRIDEILPYPELYHHKILNEYRKLSAPPMPDPTEEAYKVWCEANGYPAHEESLRIFRGGADWASGRKEH